MQIIDQFIGPYHFLSNFYMEPLSLDLGWGLMAFPSAEHAYKASFARRLEDVEAIRACKYPALAKKFWRGRESGMVADSEAKRLLFMEDVIEAKFTSMIMADRLVNTGQAILVEGNTWNDTFWGQCNGTGENWLGRLLMHRRTEIQINRSFMSD